ncbi:hypothetical protein B0H16DRAFT_1467843 [Mycena metata]|uniref:Uncharacterized protein n=1 Tax=Mycena metata TaxID=1033252 RepID=A0AAD7I341_9AGAR|nr:hypothetical protein B0H16DRAFT_1467843 [Mycena metata]
MLTATRLVPTRRRLATILGDGSYNPDELNEEEDEGDDISGSEDDIDEELDEAVARVIPTAIPTVKIPPKVNIKFEVPYKNGTQDLTGITSRTEFDDFLVAVAGRMKTRVGALNIGYIPSYNKTRTPKPAPKLLEDDESWDSLVADVQQYVKSCQSKNCGKGTLQEAKAKGKGSKGAKSKSKSKKDDSEDEVTPALKEHELFTKIEKQHHCSECKAVCFVLNSGEHHVFSHTELATWALLASRHQATIDEPPKQLGLEVSHARQKKAKNHQANTAANSNDSAPGWVQALAPVFGALLNNRLPTAPPEWQQYPQMIPPVVNDPCVHVPHSMQPGVKRFLANIFFELSDLANVSADQLCVLLAPGGVLISFGIANRLITYAKEDFTPVSNKRPCVDWSLQ